MGTDLWVICVLQIKISVARSVSLRLLGEADTPQLFSPQSVAVLQLVSAAPSASVAALVFQSSVTQPSLLDEE